MTKTAVCSATLAAAALLAGCEDLTSFTTADNETYEGNIVQAEEVRKGLGKFSRMSLTLNVAAVDTEPGVVTIRARDEEDGEETLFLDAARLRPIEGVKYDTLGDVSFPVGRLKNYLFTVPAAAGPSAGADLLVVVSLMSDGKVEVRLLLGESKVYAVFPLEKTKK